MMNSEINSENLSDADLQVLIHQLEFKKAQLELGARFERNMELFKTADPAIYAQFANYEVSELQLVLEDDCTINLATIKDNNGRFYSYNAEEFCKHQVGNYMLRSAVIDVKFAPPPSGAYVQANEIFNPIYGDLLNGLENLDIEKQPNLDVPVGLMLISGCGLGYHIIELIRQLDIRNLCLVDPHSDCFYAALHTIEFSEIFEYFANKNGLLRFYIGPERASVEPLVTTVVDKIGLHNCAHAFLYNHFESPEIKKFNEAYRLSYHRSAYGIGYFDDERVGLAHTMSHVGNGFKLFSPVASNEPLPPAFIVGNGPSLDDLLPLLEQEKNNAVIFSAGTTLGSLYKAGIKPDFHIEQERVSVVRDWISLGSDEEFRKGIIGLGLNTAHPDALSFFERVGFAKKPNDIGAAVLGMLGSDANAKELPWCNPTVTNCALAYALSMGFSEIYLIGVDMGTRDDGRHHSEKSVYADIEKLDETGKGLDVSYVGEGRTYRVPGNFSDTVSTDTALDKSRINLEILLKQFDANAYNPNYGARIEGAAAIKASNINISAFNKDKQELVSRLFELNFTEVDKGAVSLDTQTNELLDQFFAIRPKLEIKQHPANIDEAASELSRVYLYIRSLEASNPVSMYLLRGSVNMLFSLMYKAFIFTKEEQSFRKAYQLGWESYNLFLEKAYWTMQNNPLAWNKTSSKKLDLLSEKVN